MDALIKCQHILETRTTTNRKCGWTGNINAHGKTSRLWQIFYTNNWYTSLFLAKKLLERNTNLIETIKKNIQSLLKIITATKWRHCNLIARQNRDEIIMIKYKDKRDAFMLSAFHNYSIYNVEKFLFVTDYDSGKLFLNTLHQMASYCPYIRKKG